MAWVLVACGLAGSVALGTVDARQWQALSRERAQLDAARGRLEAVSAVRAAQAASAAEPPAYAVDARRWMKLGALDAGAVLRTLESAQVPGVKVSSVDIDGEARRVELQLEVSGADVVATYVQALNAGLDAPVWMLARVQSQANLQTAVVHAQLP